MNSPRKTCFVGFLTNISSLRFLYQSLVATGKLKYLLTYKLSQDHLELFFASVRGRMGFINNPTIREFKSAYKRLLLHQEIRGNRGNCLLLDDTSLLAFQNPKQRVTDQSLCDFSLQKKFGLSNEETDHDYAQISCFPVLSEFDSAVMEYISGYTCRMVSKTLKCETCLGALFEVNEDSGYLLVNFKDRGGLIHSCPSVKVVCEMTEQALQTVLKTTPGVVPLKNGLCVAITTSVLKNVLEKYD